VQTMWRPGSWAVCKYCGVATGSLADMNIETKALDEYHNILLTKDKDTRIDMLAHGFLPKSAKGLIEAGVRCIPLINIDQPSDKVVIAAGAIVF